MHRFVTLLLLLSSSAFADLVTYTSYQTITLAASTSTVYQTLPPSTLISSGASPTSTGPSPEYTSDPAFQSAILNSTNTYRKQHNATALAWNDTLAAYAVQHVAACKFEHTGGPYGENLAEGYENVTAAVDGWGNERDHFNFANGGFSEQTGHFTQLVWKNTTTTGCGRQNCGASGWLLFCEYWPPGNVGGEYQQDVQQELKGMGLEDSSLGKYVQYIHEKTGSASRVKGLSLGWWIGAMMLVLGMVL